MAIVGIAAVVLTLVAPVPDASADHGPDPEASAAWHEPIPNIPIPTEVIAECVIAFSGFGMGGLDLAEHRHRRLSVPTDALSCVDNADPGNYSWGNWNGTWEVRMEAGNDGLVNPLSDPTSFDPENERDHGGNLLQEWSHSSGYGCGDSQSSPGNLNKGDIVLFAWNGSLKADSCEPIRRSVGWSTDPNDTVGGGGESWAKFVRGWSQDPVTGDAAQAGGEQIILWGYLDVTNDDPQCFRADLMIDPLNGLASGSMVIYPLYAAWDTKNGHPITGDCDIPNMGFEEAG